MRAASVDLRERVVAAVGAGEPTSGVARRLGIGRATVDRSVRQHRATGDRRPKPLPGARPLIGTDQQPALRAPLEAAPAATLAEHCATWEGAQGVRVSSDTLRRAIARLGWRRKKDARRQRAGSGRAGGLAEAGDGAGRRGPGGQR